MKFFIISLFVLSITQEIIAQTDHSEDRTMIEATIQNYFDGWMTGDTTLLSNAMHRTCHLKFIRQDTLVMMNKTRYLSGFRPRIKPEGMSGTIVNINITRTAAAAQIELDIPNRTFTDYFNLLKENGRWYIMDKVSTSIGK